MKLYLTNKELKIPINWGYVLAFCLVWSYGYQGAINVKEWYLQLPITLYFLGILIILIRMGATNLLFKTVFLLQGKDLVAMIFLMVGWTILAFDKLNSPITGDQFFYAISSKRHEIVLITKIFPPFFSNVKMSHLIYILDIVMMAAGSHLFYSLLKNRFLGIGLITTACFIFLMLRTITILNGGGGSPFGPMQLFPLWISSAMLGVSDFAFRIPQAVGLLMIASCIYFHFKSKVTWGLAVLLGASICSIPLLFHVATMSEASIWLAACWSTVLVHLVMVRGRLLHQWLSISSIISIFILFRVPTFLLYGLFIPVFLLCNRKELAENPKNIFLVLFPVTISIPFLIFNLVNGTPAFYTSSETFSEIPHPEYTFNRIFYAIKTGIIFETALGTIGGIFLIPLGGLFIISNLNKSYLTIRVLVILLFMAAVFMFFSVRPILWIIDRYKAEYIVPFVILGGCLIYEKLIKNKWPMIFISVYALGMLLVGSYGFLSYKNPNQIFIQSGRYVRDTEIIYDYKSALISAKNEGFSDRVIISGNTSGVIPQIISGYSLGEVLKANFLLSLPVKSLIDFTSVDPVLVNDQTEIDLVLITDSGDKSLLDNFTKLGWGLWKHFPIDGGGDVVGVVRGGYKELGNSP